MVGDALAPFYLVFCSFLKNKGKKEKRKKNPGVFSLLFAALEHSQVSAVQPVCPCDEPGGISGKNGRIIE